MFTKRSGWLVAVSLGAVSVLIGCGPKYPACEKDEHCAEHSEVCVDKQCQECREDAQCTAKHGDAYECKSYKCREKPECTENSACASKGEGFVCRSEKCVPECVESADCGQGLSCEGNKCVAVQEGACKADEDCNQNEECFGGFCRAKAQQMKISSACRDMQDPGKIALGKVFFDLDKSEIRVDMRSTLDQNAECIKQAAAMGKSITVEGHCDERGSIEYNLSLGENRAERVRKYLENLGVQDSALETVTKGESQPVCRKSNESCWSKNRRAEFVQ